MESSVSLFGTDIKNSIRSSVAAMLADSASLPVILCIGSDKVTGDCLGPLVGYILTKRLNIPAFVYGTMDYPVTAKNLLSACKFIRTVHKNSKILAIDAALGDTQNIGMIFFRRQGVYAGRALQKELPKAGDYSITAVVNSGGIGDSSKLFSTSLNTVIKLSEHIAEGIHSVFAERSILCG